MPLIKSVIGAVSTVASLSPNTRSGFSVVLDLTSAVQLALSVAVTYSIGSSERPCILEVYGSIDGVVIDTYPLIQAAIPIQSGEATTRMSIDIPASLNYATVQIFNPDTGQAVTNAKADAIIQEAT